jgi:hypothetical protein
VRCISSCTVKLSLCLTKHYAMQSVCIDLRLYWLEVSGELHAPCRFIPGEKESGWEVRCVPEPVRTLWEPYRDSNCDQSVASLTIGTECMIIVVL